MRIDREAANGGASPAMEGRFKRELVALIPHLRAFARTLTGDQAGADDLAQDALMKAWDARASYQMGTNMKAWTFMILRNQFYSNKRRDWRSTSLDPEVAERSLVATDNPTSGLELDELRRAIAMLPAEQREALILIGAAGLSYDEAAEITGVAIGTVKSRVSRARDRLALIYAEGGIPHDDQPAHFAMAAILTQVADLRRSRAA
jgi:RNA polymerase sigma-70 factor (ECF subfamily)